MAESFSCAWTLLKDDENDPSKFNVGYNLDDAPSSHDLGFEWDVGADQHYMTGERPHALLPHSSIPEVQAFIGSPEWKQWVEEDSLPPEWEYLKGRRQHKTDDEIKDELHAEWAMRIEEGGMGQFGTAPHASEDFQDINTGEPMDIAFRLLKEPQISVHPNAYERWGDRIRINHMNRILAEDPAKNIGPYRHGHNPVGSEYEGYHYTKPSLQMQTNQDLEMDTKRKLRSAGFGISHRSPYTISPKTQKISMEEQEEQGIEGYSPIPNDDQVPIPDLVQATDEEKRLMAQPLRQRMNQYSFAPLQPQQIPGEMHESFGEDIADSAGAARKLTGEPMDIAMRLLKG
jgi:hypothetical protein